MSSTQVGSIHYDLNLNKEGFDKASKDVQTKMKDLGTSARNLGAKMSLIITAPALLGFKKSVNAASDLEESINAINVVFGKSADKIMAWGETAANSAGLSKSAVNAAAVPIGSQLINVGISADEAADSTLMLAQRAADLSSVFNKDLDVALTAIQSGLRGEAEPLKQFGVSLDEASIKAYALANGISDGTRVMTQQEKTVARLGLFMEQTNRVQGDFVNTSDSLANKQRILSANTENTAAALGEKMKPTMDKVLSVMGTLLDKFNGLSPKMQDFILISIGIAAVLGPVLIALGTLISLFPALAAGFAAVTAGAAGLSGFLASSAFLNPWTAFAAVAIGALVKVGIEGQALKRTMQKTSDAVVNNVKSMDDAIVNLTKRGDQKSRELAAYIQKMRNETAALQNEMGFKLSDLNPFKGGFLSGLRADGGPVAAGQSYVVGERGPEIFTPKNSGEIIANEDIKKGGSPTINLHMNGMMASSASDMRDIFNQGLRLVNQERVAQGKAAIL